MDSILTPHSNEESVAETLRWPRGPGGWGFSDEDAHTILLSPPKWDPENSTLRKPDRERARAGYRGTQARSTSPAAPSVGANNGPPQHPANPPHTHKSRVARARPRHSARNGLGNSDPRATGTLGERARRQPSPRRGPPWRAVTQPRDMRLSVQRRARRTGPPAGRGREQRASWLRCAPGRYARHR